MLNRDEALERLRSLCLALPEVEEQPWGATHAVFQVAGKVFVRFMDDHHGDGRVALWSKAPLGAQAALVAGDPERFFVPPYVGPRGWIGVRLDVGQVDLEEVSDLVEESYRMLAPRRLSAALQAKSRGPSSED